MKSSHKRNWDFVLRQYSLLAQQPGETIKSVADKLRTNLDAGYSETISNIEHILSGQANGSTASTDDKELHWLMHATAAHNGNALAALQSFQRLRDHMRREISGFFLALTDQAIYLSALLVVLFVVVIVYVVYVLPQFAAVFSSMGAELPAFTNMLLQQSLLLWPIFIAVVVLFLGAWRWTVRVKNQLASLSPFSSLACAVPLFGSFLRKYNSLLWIQYVSVLIDAGVAYSVARDIATEKAGKFCGEEAALLEIESAARIGTLSHELQNKFSEFEEIQMRSLVHARNVGLYALRIIIYLWIAMIVMGMYLPIFKLGSIS